LGESLVTLASEIVSKVWPVKKSTAASIDGFVVHHQYSIGVTKEHRLSGIHPEMFRTQRITTCRGGRQAQSTSEKTVVYAHITANSLISLRFEVPDLKSLELSKPKNVTFSRIAAPSHKIAKYVLFPSYIVSSILELGRYDTRYGWRSGKSVCTPSREAGHFRVATLIVQEVERAMDSCLFPSGRSI
jgi:hypothetical protein